MGLTGGRGLEDDYNSDSRGGKCDMGFCTESWAGLERISTLVHPICSSVRHTIGTLGNAVGTAKRDAMLCGDTNTNAGRLHT